VVRGSTISREIRLEEKWVYVPTLMVQEPFFSIPAVVTAIVQGSVVAIPVVDSLVTMVATHILDSPMAEIDEEEEPIFQESIVNHEKEQQQHPMQDVPHDEPPRKSQRARRSDISDGYEVYVSEKNQMEVDLSSFEEAIRSVHSSKWLEAMEDEMRFISTNKVWDLEKNPKDTKTMGCKWVYKLKCDTKWTVERFKA
jgi:hypothetical protein